MLATRQLICLPAAAAPGASFLRPECSSHLVQTMSICHKSKLPPRKHYPWPYERLPYNMLTWLLDPWSRRRINENSKIIQVEGNVKSGKWQFAKILADELDMKLMPPINFDNYYVNTHGFDYRALNPLLPERLRVCDLEMWHECPTRHSTVHMIYHLFRNRYFQYIKALQHVLNTGQGVVLVRSAFTERVFIDAMDALGWLPKGHTRPDGVRFYDFKYRYIYTRNCSLPLLFKPHLTLYIDAPIEACLERIKNSDDPVIATSKALTPEFLGEIEQSYEMKVLPRQERHGYVKKVDWKEKFTQEDILDVLDQVEPLSFDYYWRDTNFEDWNEASTYLFYTGARARYTTKHRVTRLMNMIVQPWYDVAGLGDSITHSDLVLRRKLFENHTADVGNEYSAYRDPKVRGIPRTLLSGPSFGEECDEMLRADFR